MRSRVIVRDEGKEGRKKGGKQLEVAVRKEEEETETE